VDTTHIPAPRAASKSHPTAADILRLKRTRAPAEQAISLEMEVDQYLSDSNEGTGILEFWQVT
jgi:hypothetical protein